MFLEEFTLQGRVPVTQVSSPVIHGTFTPAQTSVTQNVVFSNTGLVRGRVLRGGAPFSAGIGLDSFGSFVALTNLQGEYVVTGVLPGAHTLTALNGAITGSIGVTVVAGK